MIGVSEQHIDAIHRAYTAGGADAAVTLFCRLFPDLPASSAARCVSFVLRWHS